MDIKHAIERVEELTQSIRLNQKVIAKLESLESIKKESRNIVYDSVRIKVPTTELIKWTRAETEELQEELGKLQGVIDMANAALKGVLSDER